MVDAACDRVGGYGRSDDFVPSTFRNGRSVENLASGLGHMHIGSTTRTTGHHEYRKQKNSVFCGGCKKGVEGRVLDAMDQQWHPSCFKCKACDNAIDVQADQGFMVRNRTDPWCKKCDKWDKQLNKQTGSSSNHKYGGQRNGRGGHSNGRGGYKNGRGRGRGGSSGPTRYDHDKQAAIQSNINRGKERCNKCTSFIAGQAVGHGGTWYCAGCFNCTKCGLMMNDSAVHDRGNFYHPDCAPATKLYKSFCAGCGEGIDGKFVKLPDAEYKWHKGCLRCPECEVVLSSGFMMKEGYPYCTKCGRSNKWVARHKMGSKVVKGIRFNQVTRKIERGAHY